MLCLALLLGSQAGRAQRQTFSRMYVFGDSYSDLGEGYLDGDGPTAVAYLADALGTTLRPANAPGAEVGSMDFAISGAQTAEGKGVTVAGALIGFGMKNQLEQFTARVRSGAVRFDPSTTLFFLAGGLNDRNLPSPTTVYNLESEIRALYALGGRHFAVALLPERIPAFRDVGVRLNPVLAGIPAELTPQLPDATIVLSHWGPFFDEVLTHPAKYGLSNTTDACAGRAIFHQDATPCATPAAYFYYHKDHPSTAAHRAVGAMLYRELTGSQGATRAP
ncbi:MAG: GDSL family lipase [Acidobacteriota bacterium]|nr:GDSL family lipase [Acidobacteriota bacterium]